MCLFSKKADLKKGRSIYINVEPEDVVQYETISSLENYKVLENACICGIDDLKHLSLFKLKREKYNIKHEYWYRWEYHASFSPIWSQRIRQFGGYPDYTKQKVIFKEESDDEQIQLFYELYGYEPDEQSITTQLKNIMELSLATNNKIEHTLIYDIYNILLSHNDNNISVNITDNVTLFNYGNNFNIKTAMFLPLIHSSFTIESDSDLYKIFDFNEEEIKLINNYSIPIYKAQELVK